MNNRAPIVVALAALTLAACRQDMHDQPKYEPLEASDFFEDGQAARPLVEGTVARGQLNADAILHTGKMGAALVDGYPFPITREVLERGRERFNVYCAPCHDRTGSGQGMVVRRGFRQPTSFHTDRLRQAPTGHFFDVMTNGFGVMPDYRTQIAVRDRWAVAAYVKALQLSQHATVDDVPAERRGDLDSGATGPAPAQGPHTPGAAQERHQ
jgi:hypothetical protein